MVLDLLSNSASPAFDLLEWPLISDHIANFAHLKVTKEKIKEKSFFQDPQKINQSLDEISHAFDFFSNDLDRELQNVFSQIDSHFDFNAKINLLLKDGILDLKEINQIISMAEVAQQVFLILNNFLKNNIQFNLNEKRIFQQKIIRPWRRFVDISGNINLEQHPILGPMIRKLKEFDITIRETLQYLINQQYTQDLQYQSFDLIYDHYVLPIRSDRYHGSLGKIIAHSETGKTLFVEPTKIQNLSQKRLELLNSIQAIENKICKEFCLLLNDCSNFLKENWYYYSHQDQLLAKARYCYQFNFSRPEISAENCLSIQNFFHPLIKNAVTNSIDLQSHQQGVIISGPNTGGKTLSLKAIGLCQLFLRMGMYVPAKRAILSMYEKIFFFGNDGQDLSQGLSSFSAEAGNYLKLLDELANTNLILIDEIFNSTSSEDASALAIGFFEAIKNKSKSHILVSTHHQMLKTLMHQNKDFISAHVGYDIEKLSPTYQIIWGAPGNSMAFSVLRKIAKDSDVSQKIISRATKTLDTKKIAYEEMLRELSQKEFNLQNEIMQTRELKIQLQNQKLASEGLLKLAREEALADFNRKLKKHERTLLTTIEEVKQGKLHRNIAIDRLHSIRNQHRPDESKNIDQQKNLTEPQEIILGGQYFYPRMNQIVTVQQIDQINNIAFVNKGSFKFKVNLNELRLKTGMSNKQLLTTVRIEIPKSETISTRLDARGLRLEEFQKIVEENIYFLRLASIPYLEIIHGHGTGVLKDWLRQYLKNQGDISIDPNDQTNDGSTTIKLKS